MKEKIEEFHNEKFRYSKPLKEFKDYLLDLMFMHHYPTIEFNHNDNEFIKNVQKLYDEFSN